MPRPRSPTKCPELTHKFQKLSSEMEQAMMAYLEVDDDDDDEEEEEEEEELI